MRARYRLPSRLILCGLACAAAGAASGPRSVKDFLALIPERYLGCAETCLTPAARLAMIDVNDAANGWLRLVGRGDNAFDGWIELALFRRGPDGPMLGVAVNRCGPLCEQQIAFLRRRGENWEEITARVFAPLPAERIKELYRAEFPGDEFADDPPVLYRLPRQGSDILLVTQEPIAGREAVLARYRLQAGRFILLD